MLHILSWWLLIQLLGLVALPLAYRLFRWLPGRGYTFAKPLGLLLTSYLLWLGASLGFLRNTTGGIVAAIALVAGASFWLYARRDEDDPALLDFLREHGRLILTVEVLFAVAFCAWVALRAYAPDKIMSSGGEKFMEIAFLNAILKSRSFPPHDPWLSGFGISYYYFGYVMMALMTRLSGVVSGVGFELYDALLFALTMTGAFGVVYSLIAGSDDRRSLSYGLLGSLFVAVLSNLEGLMEALYARGVLPMRFWRWLDLPDLIEAGRVTGSWYPGHGWWWWRASRVIRDRDLLGRPLGINPIDEFPFFSFMLGDNHPHVLALPFVLMAIALALNLLRWASERTGKRADVSLGPLRPRDGARLALYALALGALGFLNTWDFPIYLGLTVLAYGLGLHIASKGEENDAPSILHSPSSILHSPSSILIKMVVLGVGLLASGIILYLPFYLGFQSQAGGLLPYLLPPTRLPQYLVMFGPFIFIVAWFLLDQLWARLDEAGQRLRSTALAVAQWWGLVALLPLLLLVGVMLIALLTPSGQQIVQNVLTDQEVQQAIGGSGPLAAAQAILLARLRDPWLHLTLSFLIALAAVNLLSPHIRTTRSERTGEEHFAALLMLTGLALTFAVEFVYLRDNFGVRMNTVFKFYYQGWVMMGCASAYAVWRLRSRLEGAGRYVFQVGLVVLVGAGLVYPVMASYSRVHGFQQRLHLNGATNIARDHPDDWAAIEWLRQNAPNTAVILEVPGQSYDYEGRISAFTGLQAVLGWSLHEGQWRGDYVEQGKREPDIQAIYTTKSGRRALELLHKWKVDYVIVGPPERRYVERLCSEQQCQPTSALETLATALQPVFEQGRTTVYRVP